ncbi:MAG: hypothetical protein ACE5FU_04495 [Nitrospinota bacterium]
MELFAGWTFSSNDDGDAFLKIKKSIPANPLPFREIRPYRKKKGDRRKQENREEAKDHFDELSGAVEKAHEDLAKSGSRYRYCIYKSKDNILLEVVVLAAGSAKRVKILDITCRGREEILKMIQTGEGLIVDESA